MTDGVRNGLGMLCIALIALVIALATAGNADVLSGAAKLIALVLGIIGLGMVASALLRRT